MLKAFAIHQAARIARMIAPMTDTCIFCRITKGEAQATVVYRDERLTAFRDIHPVAPMHILIVPNRHIQSLNDAGPDDEPLLGHMLHTAHGLAVQEGIANGGYRLIMNTGPDGGQTVYHLHLHLLGGRAMNWPPG